MLSVALGAIGLLPWAGRLTASKARSERGDAAEQAAVFKVQKQSPPITTIDGLGFIG